MSYNIDDLLVQQYNQEAWQYTKTFPSQQIALFIRRICMNPRIPKHFPFLKLLTDMCKDLLINELELALLAIILEKTLLPQPYAMSANDLVYASYAAKCHMNDEMEIFAYNLEQKFVGFRESFNIWIASHFIKVSAKKINMKFSELNVPANEEESLIDYNFYVDEVLELTPLINLESIQEETLPEAMTLDTVLEPIKNFN